MALALVAYLEMDQTDFDWIQSVRKEEDELYFNIVNPHFTIVFPVSSINESAFSEHIKSCLIGAKSFGFTLDHAVINKDAFNDYCHTFLVPKEGYNQIVKLHDLSYTGILKSELREDIPFIPHVGIGSSKDNKLMQILANKLNKQSFNIKGKTIKLDLISLEGDRVETIKFFKLKI